MGPRFRKAAWRDLVILPDVGRVLPGQVLEGPEFELFVRFGLLERIEESPKERVNPSPEPISSETPVESQGLEESVQEGPLEGEDSDSLTEGFPVVELPVDEESVRMEKRAVARRKK